jgi:two-component sensor histidine kinase
LLQELVDVVAGAAGPAIRVELEAPNEIVLAVDRAIPCSMIVHELLANAVQHAFPEARAGTIKLACAKLDERTVRVSVSDDGIGLPEGFETKNTLGWTLLRALARQVRSDLVIREGVGTLVEVTLRDAMV